MKIVINNCYGGFSLSYEAMALYLATKFKQAYFYGESLQDVLNRKGQSKQRIFKRIPLKDLTTTSQHYYHIYCTTEHQGEELDHFPEHIFKDREIDRTDPDLISVVELLGPDKASGRYASLEIKEITDGAIYRIDSYDGIEQVEFRDNMGWEIATSHKQTTSIDAKFLEMMYQNIIKGE